MRTSVFSRITRALLLVFLGFGTTMTAATAEEVQVQTTNPQWSPGIKESAGIGFTCPGGTVIDGMQHKGDENGTTHYRCAALLPVGIEPKECVWAPANQAGIKESQGYYACPGDKVMVGREHLRDENGPTWYYCCDLSYNKTTTVYVDGQTCGWSAPQKQSSTNYSCPSNQVMTARDHTGDENGKTEYYCCGLTLDVTKQKTLEPK